MGPETSNFGIGDSPRHEHEMKLVQTLIQDNRIRVEEKRKKKKSNKQGVNKVKSNNMSNKSPSVKKKYGTTHDLGS